MFVLIVCKIRCQNIARITKLKSNYKPNFKTAQVHAQPKDLPAPGTSPVKKFITHPSSDRLSRSDELLGFSHSSAHAQNAEILRCGSHPFALLRMTWALVSVVNRRMSVPCYAQFPNTPVHNL